MNVFTVDCWKKAEDNSFLTEETKYFLNEGNAKYYEYYMNQNGWESKIDNCKVMKGAYGLYRMIVIPIKIEEIDRNE